MISRDDLSRRGMLMKLGLLFNGAVGVMLTAPIVRYLLSPAIRERNAGYESWLALGGLLFMIGSGATFGAIFGLALRGRPEKLARRRSNRAVAAADRAHAANVLPCAAAGQRPCRR